MKPPTPESTVKHDIRSALGRMRDLVLWQNTSGVSEVHGRKMRFGLCVGASDLIGILSPSGRFVALEIKAGNNQPSAEQEMFLDLVRFRGGFACAVWSVDEAIAAIGRARNGESS